VAIIANAFNIHAVDFSSENRKPDAIRNSEFLYSANLKSEARLLGWSDGKPLDFTRIFSGAELGMKVAWVSCVSRFL
jgi:hypothetical protein